MKSLITPILGILLQICLQIKHATSHSSLTKYSAFLSLNDELPFLFDKVQVKGEALKAVRNLSWPRECTDIPGNILRMGGEESGRLHGWWSRPEQIWLNSFKVNANSFKLKKRVLDIHSKTQIWDLS